MLTRRDAVLGALFGSGMLGLRAIATGLPIWYLANPRKATAQDLQCAITAREKAQFLVVSANSNGDPINCNCPGTYENPAAKHPAQAEMAKTNVTLGGKTFGAALPWATTEDGGKLTAATLAKTNFFHYRTGSVVHGDQAKVMKLMGGTNGGEMLVSIYARYLSACFGTVQSAPIAVGAGFNASELLSYGGSTAPFVSPVNLKAMLGGTSSGGGGGGMFPGGGGGSGTAALKNLRSLRDQTLDKLNALAKSDGSNVQKAFLDELASSQKRVRELSANLSTLLTKINSDNVDGQIAAVTALFSANVTSVVSMRIAFGGDNHSDQNLQAEADQHGTGIASIQALMDALDGATTADGTKLSERVTFATLNVFGRNLNGISKTESLAGRDHYANHAVAVLVGKNIAPGVTGGLMNVTGFGASGLGAADIESATGLGKQGGDIPSASTYGALGRTLGVALGIPSEVMARDFNASAGGKVVNTTLNGVTG